MYFRHPGVHSDNNLGVTHESSLQIWCPSQVNAGELPRQFQRLEQLVALPECCAVGETGIDQTTNCTVCATHCAVPERFRLRITSTQQSALEDMMGVAVLFSRPMILIVDINVLERGVTCDLGIYHTSRVPQPDVP